MMISMFAEVCETSVARRYATYRKRLDHFSDAYLIEVLVEVSGCVVTVHLRGIGSMERQRPVFTDTDLADTNLAESYLCSLVWDACEHFGFRGYPRGGLSVVSARAGEEQPLYYSSAEDKFEEDRSQRLKQAPKCWAVKR